MIKMLIIFVVFILLFLPTCYNLGNLVLEKINVKLNRYLKIFVGMFSLIALFQIAYYPAMTLQLSSSYLTIVGSLIVLLLLALDIKNIKSFKELFTDRIVLISLIITGFIFYIYMRTMPGDLWGYDDAFYLPLMAGNANIQKILSFQPRTGELVDKITNLYASQGYYMIGSYIISLFNISRGILSLNFNYIPLIYYTMSFSAFLSLVLVTVGMTIEIAKKRWQKVLFVSLAIFFSIFLAIDSNLLNNIYIAGYVGPFLTLTVYMPFVLFCMSKYFNGENQYYKLITILFFALLSIASFNLFIICILIYVLLFMQLTFKKNIIISEYMMLVLPILAFIPSFLIHNNILAFIIQLVLVIGLIILFRATKQVLKIDNKCYSFIKKVIFIIPFVFAGLSLLIIIFKLRTACTPIGFIRDFINTIFPLYGTLPFHYAQILITAFYVFLLVCYILFVKNEKKTAPVIIYSIALMVAFLNPLVISFVATYITASTYNRVYVLLFNPFISYIIIEGVFSKWKLKEIWGLTKEKLIIIACVIVSIGSIGVELKEFEHWVQTYGRSDKLYRMRERDLSASNLLNGFIKDYNIQNIIVASNHSELKVLNPEYRFLYDRTIQNDPDENFTKQAYYYAFLYYLNQGIINQEYYKKYSKDVMDVFKYTGTNFLTIDVECPNTKKNFTSNILCEEPIMDETNPLIHDNQVEDYYKDIAVYSEIKSHLTLIYQTERYKLYYVE